jgi:two-component system chemotaxis response regulator CheB
MNIAVAPKPPAATIGRRIRVMVVDDAAVMRGMFARWIEAEADLELVAALRGAREAIDKVESADPDVVLLDIEMPELNGLAALPMLLAKRRDLTVIMASTLTRRNAEISLKALALGATDYIPKPTSRSEGGASVFRREMIEKVRHLGQRAKRLRPVENLRLRGAKVAGRGIAGKAVVETAAADFSLRPMPVVMPRVLVIGASTGGPQALNALMACVNGVLERAPILITQHMPPTFTAILAEHLGRVSRHPTYEAVDGTKINSRTIYIAPGGRHMRVERRNGVAVIALDNGPPINFCKPSVDPLFTSAAELWGSWVLGLMLTGMGADGLQGAEAIVASGGAVIAQDEASSVVWGMPGHVVQAGLCSAVLPLAEIGPRLSHLFGGDGS